MTFDMTDFDAVPTSFHISILCFIFITVCFHFCHYVCFVNILQQNLLSLCFHEVSKYESLPRQKFMKDTETVHMLTSP